MKKILILWCFMLVAFFSFGQEPVISLYKGAAPGSESWNWNEALYSNSQMKMNIIYNVSRPTLTVYLPSKETANGTAVIIAPGGAFHILSIDNEGTDVAKWLNERGITAFVLKYRLVKSETAEPFNELMPLMADFKKLDEINAPVVKLATEDGLAAVKYVRERAGFYGIDPKRIGFMGFSAGGTLTMSVVLSANDSNRPNFVAPIYAYGNAVIGNRIPGVQTPIFLAAASDDNLGLASHSVDIYSKWLTAKQPAELHMYEKGGHGFGMQKHNTSSDNWTSDFENWLKFQGLITK